MRTFAIVAAWLSVSGAQGRIGGGPPEVSPVPPVDQANPALKFETLIENMISSSLHAEDEALRSGKGNVQVFEADSTGHLVSHQASGDEKEKIESELEAEESAMSEMTSHILAPQLLPETPPAGHIEIIEEGEDGKLHERTATAEEEAEIEGEITMEEEMMQNMMTAMMAGASTSEEPATKQPEANEDS